MNRAILYARVSTDDQIEKYGLVAQRRACQQYADANGWQIAAELSDDGISGATLERHALQQAMQMVKAGQADAILTLCPDRISRDLFDLLAVDKQTRLVFVSEHYDASSTSRLFFQIKGAFGEYERRLIAERTQRGRMEKARSGEYVGGRVAFGYRVEKSELVSHPGEALVVRDIFSWASEGVSIRGICQRLNAAGVKPQRGASWGKSSISRILRNETYAGVCHYNKGSRVNRTERRTLKPAGEWIALPAPAIVEREAFDTVQLQLARTAALLRGRPSHTYMLRGLIWCGRCRKRMCGDPGKGTRCYRCAGRDRLTFTGCGARSVNAGHLESSIWSTVRDAFTDRRTLRAAIVEHRQAIFDAVPDPADLSRRLAELRRREDHAVSMLFDPDLADHRAKIKAEVAAMRTERARVEAELRAAGRGTETADVDALVREMRGLLVSLPEGDRREFLTHVVERIDVSEGEAAIACVIHGAADIVHNVSTVGTITGIPMLLKVKVSA